MPQFILTISPGSEGEAVRELRSLNAKMTRWIAPGVGLVNSSLSWEETAAKLAAAPPIWIRHVHPVQSSAAINNDARDLLLYESLLQPAMMTLDIEGSFSIQTRLMGDGMQWQYSRFDLNERLAALVVGWGAEVDVREPFQVVSVTCTPTETFIGLSRAQDNLSNWTGGERRFKREPDQISRAEFKLLEALETFRIELPANGRALDLGAAPGGWTRLLALKGLDVVAVDPAKLDPRIAALPNVRHIPKTIQETNLDGLFDVIVNDMRMEAREAARVMLSLADHLSPDGIVVMTLKLPSNRSGRAAAAALNILSQHYRQVGARQLFHNRSEITLALSN